jgi:hypothetical protein
MPAAPRSRGYDHRDGHLLIALGHQQRDGGAQVVGQGAQGRHTQLAHIAVERRTENRQARSRPVAAVFPLGDEPELGQRAQQAIGDRPMHADAVGNLLHGQSRGSISHQLQRIEPPGQRLRTGSRSCRGLPHVSAGLPLTENGQRVMLYT